MKTRLLFSTVLIFSALTIFARAYPGISYQAVARDSSGSLLANQLVGLQFTILAGGAGGDTVYVETDTATTNKYGLFTVVIGIGTQVSGSWIGINWATNAYYVQVAMDATGGTSYVNYGSPSELNYVPLAYYALNSGNVYWRDSSGNIYNTNSGGVGIGTVLPPALFSVNGNALVGLGQNMRSNLGLTVDLRDTSMYQPNADITDVSRGISVVNESQTAYEMADISLRTDPNVSDQIFDMKLVDPATGSSSVIYTFGSPGGFIDQFAFTNNGQLGVGTSTPSATLEVNGNEVLSYGAARTISTPDASGSNIAGYDLNLQAGTAQRQGTISNGGNINLVAGGSNNAGGQSGGNITLTTGTNDFNNGVNPGSRNGDVIFYGGLNGYQNGVSEIMRINGTTGHVGIGTSTPNAPLHVSTANSSGITAPSSVRTYFDVGSSLTTNTSASNNIMVQADGWYWANGGGFLATSDARIKDIKGKTDNAADLQTLTGIEITDYLYKDKVSNGNKPQKKVIAQQVKEVYPQAINQSEGIIPNVYATATSVDIKDGNTIITTAKPHDFKTGDEVKLIMEKSGEKTLPVTVIDDHTFSVATPINEKVFVYGKEVKDLLTVDYDAISMLNISATQELAKELKAVKEENAQLKAALSTLQGQVTNLSAKVEASAAGQVGSK